jgi:endonuclease/exonuclease/phosphatase family metal-dependent hydrolase
MPSGRLVWLGIGMLLSGCTGEDGPRVSIPPYGPADSGTSAHDAADAGDEHETAADSGADAVAEAADAPTEAAPSETLVVVTLNTHSFQEGSNSLAKLTAIGQGLASLHADLVGLNEVMSGTFWSYDYGGAVYDGAEIIRLALESASVSTWHIAREGFAHWSTGEEMSNVVLSRFPIEAWDSRSLTTTDGWPGPGEKRNVVYARVQIGGIGPVSFFVTHTWGWDSSDTLAQVQEVKSFMQNAAHGDEALSLLVGDLNVTPDQDAYAAWLSPPLGLVDTAAQANPGSLAVPTTLDGNHIDYILAEPATQAQPGYESFLAFDGTSLPVVSDHKAVVTVVKLGER